MSSVKFVYNGLPECCGCKLIEDTWVACGVVIVAVAFRLDTEIVQIHVIPANDSW